VTTLTLGIGRRLVAEYDDNKAQGLQCAHGEAHPVDTEDRTAVQKNNSPMPMITPAIVSLPICHAFGAVDGRTLSVVNDMPRKSPVIMIRIIRRGVRIAWPVMSRPIARNRTWTTFFVIEFSV
jgi:hypothetical protein